MSFIKKILYICRLFKRAFGGYKWHIVILAAIGFLSGILEGIGANALIPLFSFITGSGPAEDFISRAIERFFGFIGFEFTLSYLLIFIALLFILKAALLFLGSYIQLKITLGYQKKTRIDIFKDMLYASWSHLLKQKIGHLEKVLSVEIGYVTNLLNTVSSLILIVTSLTVFIVVALNISPPITLVAFGTGVFVMFLFYPLVNKIRMISRDYAAIGREASHFINEHVIGMKTIKATSSSSALARKSEVFFETVRKLQMKRTLLKNIFGSFFQPFGIVFLLLLFSFSYKTGNFHLPSFVAIVYLIQRIFTQVQGLQTHMQTIWDLLPYVEHVLFYKSALRGQVENGKAGSGFVFQKNFSFQNVFFTYEHGKETLSGVSFSVLKGSFIGLIGPSGAGKTTIVDLMLRLFQPTAGGIFLDDIPILEINLDKYRRGIGYVSQDIHLINGTVANNIRFFDDKISDDEMIRAAKQANVYDVIEALPKKFETVVGERGVRLSVGQRQRIVIARTLARKPQLLILDEATSALDNESEKRIQEVIENLKGKITVLVIAHRLGTVMNCNKLLVLQNGKIIEQGRPKDLLADKESYFYKTYNIRK